MSLPERMKFGIFLGPFHRVGENPTLAMDRRTLSEMVMPAPSTQFQIWQQDTA